MWTTRRCACEFKDVIELHSTCIGNSRDNHTFVDIHNTLPDFTPYSTPELWNRLSSHVKSAGTLQFKTSLKAPLFSKWLYCFSHYVSLHFFFSFYVLCMYSAWNLVTECTLYIYVLLLLLSVNRTIISLSLNYFLNTVANCTTKINYQWGTPVSQDITMSIFFFKSIRKHSLCQCSEHSM